jgi:hypothetical protein
MVFVLNAYVANFDSLILETGCKVVLVSTSSTEDVPAFSTVVPPSYKIETLAAMESLACVLVGNPLSSDFVFD